MVIGELAQVMNTTIKRYNHYAVLSSELADESDRRLVDILHAACHAGTHVEEKHNAERDLFGAEIRDSLLHSIFEEEKILRRQLRHIASRSITYQNRQIYQSRLELNYVLITRWLLAGLGPCSGL